MTLSQRDLQLAGKSVGGAEEGEKDNKREEMTRTFLPLGNCETTND